MTINVALVTNEALILGCDSVASTTGYFLDPSKFVLKDQDENWIQDGDGNWNAKFKFGDLNQFVTNAWGGVQKMFVLCGGQKNSHTNVAAITSGLATLLNRTMTNFAGEFHRQTLSQPSPETVQEVVEKFVQFMGNHYDSHYNEPGTPDEWKDDIEFLIGGYGRNDALPSLYRVKLKDRSNVLVYAPTGDSRTGLSWAGQATSVERLLRGYDPIIRFQLSREFDSLYRAMSERALKIVEDVLSATGVQMPESVDTSLPIMPTINGIFDRHLVDIDYQNMPVQDAMDFVAYLVNLESGRHKFVRGVPTVGGRTHIGLITRNEGFRIINPPALTHRNTGFARDL